AELGVVQRDLLQANLYDEASKDGLTAEETKLTIADANQYPNVKICGLMAFPPLTKDEEGARRQFRKARAQFEEVQDQLPQDELTLSMRTSSDFRAALLEGSNCLRLGEVLLRERGRGRTP